jgi:hypothetical protein
MCNPLAWKSGVHCRSQVLSFGCLWRFHDISSTDQAGVLGQNAGLQKHELPTVSHSPLRSACGPANSHDNRIIVCSSPYTILQSQNVSSEAMSSIACMVRSPALRRECLGLILRIHPDPWLRSTPGPGVRAPDRTRVAVSNILDRSRKCQLPYLEICLLSRISA